MITANSLLTFEQQVQKCIPVIERKIDRLIEEHHRDGTSFLGEYYWRENSGFNEKVVHEASRILLGEYAKNGFRIELGKEHLTGKDCYYIHWNIK